MGMINEILKDDYIKKELKRSGHGGFLEIIESYAFWALGCLEASLKRSRQYILFLRVFYIWSDFETLVVYSI